MESDVINAGERKDRWCAGEDKVIAAQSKEERKYNNLKDSLEGTYVLYLHVGTPFT